MTDKTLKRNVRRYICIIPNRCIQTKAIEKNEEHGFVERVSKMS